MDGRIPSTVAAKRQCVDQPTGIEWCQNICGCCKQHADYHQRQPQGLTSPMAESVAEDIAEGRSPEIYAKPSHIYNTRPCLNGFWFL